MPFSVFRAAAACFACLLTGCATTSGLEATKSRSGFDGGRVVNIAGHGAACQTTTCIGLGAQWSEKTSDRAVLTAYVFNLWTPITDAKLNIDGRIVDLQPMPGITNLSRPGEPLRQSRRDFAVPLDLVRQVASAKRVWLRLQTNDGYLEDAIIDGATDSKAYHALRRFLTAVDGG